MPVTRSLRQEKYDRRLIARPRLSASPSPSTSSQNSIDSSGFKSFSSVTTADIDGHDSATMKRTRRVASTSVSPEILTTDENSQTTTSPENSSRRISGRIRKPTAKVQAQVSPKTFATTTTNNSGEELRTDVVVTQEPHKEGEQVVEIGDDEEGDTVVVATIEDVQLSKSADLEGPPEPSEPRTSQRERKPTVKVLEALNAVVSDVVPDGSASAKMSPSKKRSASPQHEDRPRKIVRLTYNPLKAPSNLRFSQSTNDIRSARNGSPQPLQPSSTLIPTIVEPVERTPKPKLKRKSRAAKPTLSASVRLTAAKATSDSSAIKDVQIEKVNNANLRKCDLSCLSPSTKLLAIAKIAAESSDSDDEEDVRGTDSKSTSLFELWMERARDRFCECSKTEHAHASRANSIELMEALRPNTVVLIASNVASSTGTPLLQRAETSPSLVRSKETSHIHPISITRETWSSQPLPPARSTPTQASVRLESWKSPRSGGSNVAVSNDATQHVSQPSPSKRTYEDRMRDEFSILTQLRSECFRRGILIKYDMTNDHLKSLISRHDSQKGRTNGNSCDARTITSRQNTFPGSPPATAISQRYGSSPGQNNSSVSDFSNAYQFHAQQPQKAAASTPTSLTASRSFTNSNCQNQETEAQKPELHVPPSSTALQKPTKTITPSRSNAGTTRRRRKVISGTESSPPSQTSSVSKVQPPVAKA